MLSRVDRMRPAIFGVVGALRPAGPAAPLPMPRAHLGPVADAKKRRAHDAAALEAEIDFGGVGVTMIRADLAGLPAGDGDVALFDAPEDFLDVLLAIVHGFFGKAEDLHCFLLVSPLQGI